ncbi:hypothetical protein LCGC14_2107250, partial [marine sediment metagenome]
MSGFGFRRDISNSRLDVEVAGVDALQMTATAITIPAVITSGLTIVAGGLALTAGDLTLTAGGLIYEGSTAKTQATNHTTTVSFDPGGALAGVITLASVNLGTEASAVFTVTNAAVAVGDVVVACIGTYADGGGTGTVSVHDVAAGSFKIQLDNTSGADGFNDATTINFVVIQT